MKIWWATNVFWLIFFTGASIVIRVRNVDGAGIAQTPELKMLAFIILGGFFIVVLIGQLLFLYFVRKRKAV
ncbi:hypothetical protein OSO01_07040 [Oceanobacillus sojae]|uniref:NADH:ubiquinone oxidoreductase n=2 Tax=Oceanobacillus sojae TaxID=582851 RepID=A0A511ZET7_9BACI|nr:hypothetical protein OSO01_07040 [Oceanobacillus sojae]